ncbi:MAG: hypothetical protein KDD94_04585 [Calditrichaeota bacterium]|nr:hypothetical protein [Calditrichota bacterium]
MQTTISELLKSVLDEQDVTLIDFQSKADRRGMKLLITVDTEKNISLDQCAEISKAFSAQLDEADLISGPYTIEVSSPGLTANLTHDLQFRKAIGKLLNVTYLDDEGIDRTEDIKLESIDDKQLTFKRKNEALTLDKARIKSAKLRLQW